MALPERLYYPLEKAAEKLAKDGSPCDVDDLLHFAAIGKLEICARLKHDHSATTAVLANAPNWMHELGDTMTTADGKRVAMFWAHTDFGYIRFMKEGSGVYAAAFNTLFAISHSSFQEIEMHPMSELISIENVYLTMPRGYVVKMSIDGLSEEIEYDESLSREGSAYTPHFILWRETAPVSELVITASELVRLKAGGEQIPEQKEEKIHGNTIRNTVRREEILSAALYCLKHFPDECVDVPKLVTKIEEKALQFWPKTGEPPLAKSTMEDQLRRILNN